MKIKRLLKSINFLSLHGNPHGEVNGIAYDSRKVKKNYIFVAIPGEKEDGMKYESEAAQKGAVAVVAKEYNSALKNILQIIVDNPRTALSLLSMEFYNNPSAKLSVIGITGTNGKTTTAYLIESILKSASRKPAVIGTINYRFMDKKISAVNTTPESLDLNIMMSDYLSQGATDIVMEVSSHAISQGRVNGINFDTGIFTNLTQDHLDYYRTMENYYAAKAMFFERLLPASEKSNKFAILNSDDSQINRVKLKKGIHALRFGSSKLADIRLMESYTFLDGVKAKLSTPIGEMELLSPLTGDYNIYNIMAAVAAAIVSNISIEHIKQGVELLHNVPGRTEKIDNPKGIYIFVDYAHTPDALQKVLKSLNKLKKNKIICVFGCGGDRDKDKRPIMGDIAAGLADITILTSDNPRSEEPQKIISDIEKGINGARKAIHIDRADRSGGRIYTIIADRKQAIKTALDVSEKNDVVLIAGKGHEDYQIVGGRTLHLSDKEEIKSYFGLPY